MMIWEFADYRRYLIEKVGGESTRSGLRKQLAEAIPVHTTYISQILSGRAELSLEQAESINEFFAHTEDEGEYFLTLVMKERAGSKKLKARFESKLKAMRDLRLNIQKRVGQSDEISQKDREKFYSNHYYGAIHVLTGIKEFKSVEKLAQALNLPRPRVQAMVDFCLRLGVLEIKNGDLSPGKQHIHLGNQSELILKHHSNWRQHCLQSLQFLDPEDLHYSACVSIDEATAFKIKEALLSGLKDKVKLISAAPEETAYVLSFDFYRLLSR